MHSVAFGTFWLGQCTFGGFWSRAVIGQGKWPWLNSIHKAEVLEIGIGSLLELVMICGNVCGVSVGFVIF